MPNLDTLAWLLGQLAVVALSALALRLSVGAVARSSGKRNDFARAMLVAAALTLLGHGVERALPANPLLGAAVMLVLWFVVVRWAYALSLLETLLVALLVVVLSLGAVALLAALTGSLRAALPA